MLQPLYRRMILPLTLLVASALPVGCSSSMQSSPGFVSAYESGRYSEAHRSASARSMEPGRNAEASLIAGLAAHELGDDAEAERWLKPVTLSSDRELAGRAAATLGLMARKRNDAENAAAYLSQACSHLTGDEAARAGLYAGDAYKELGRIDAARMQYHLALALAKDPSLRNTLESRTDSAAYTVQLGAYSSLANATRYGEEIAPKTRRLGLGSPQVVMERTPSGRPLYLVQVGEFMSRREADAARRSLGITSIVATASADDAD